MAEQNLIQVQRAAGYAREQAYIATVHSGYTKRKKADDAMLDKVRKLYHKTLIVESQIKEIRAKLIEIASAVNSEYPKCKPVEVGKAEDHSDYGVQCIYFGGSEARVEFEMVNPLYSDWIACC